MTPTAIRVHDWSANFETHESRKRIGPLSWVAFTTSHDGKRYRRLTKLKHAAEIYCAWVSIVRVAATCPVRGLLIDSRGDVLTATDLSDITGFPASIFDIGIKALCSREIGWLEVVNLPESAAPCRSLPERTRDLPEPAEKVVLPKPNHTEPNRTEPNKTEPETEQYRTEQNRTESRRGLISPDSSGSGSFSVKPPASRAHARMHWQHKVSALHGLTRGKNGGRHPEDSPQRKADSTSTDRMFDDTIWPEGMSLEEGEPRYAKAMALIPQAQSNADKPMAYLTAQIVKAFAVGGSDP